MRRDGALAIAFGSRSTENFSVSNQYSVTASHASLTKPCPCQGKPSQNPRFSLTGHETDASNQFGGLAFEPQRPMPLLATFHCRAAPRRDRTCKPRRADRAMALCSRGTARSPNAEKVSGLRRRRQALTDEATGVRFGVRKSYLKRRATVATATVSATHLLSRLFEQLRHQTRPSGLMARAQSHSGVPVKIFVEQNQVAP